jgi:hypothetical protein
MDELNSTIRFQFDEGCKEFFRRISEFPIVVNTLLLNVNGYCPLNFAPSQWSLGPDNPPKD